MTRFRLLLSLLLGTLTALAPMALSPARAEDTVRVAAVVNDDIVSMRDLEERIRVALLSSNLPDNVETRRRVGTPVLRRLIDERLQMQEAHRLKIAITPAEIAGGLATIERQNNMDNGGFEKFLKSKDIDAETIRDQIRAELAWMRVVRGELVPDLHIGEQEIDARLLTMKASLGKPEYLVAEIFLPVDDPNRAEEQRNLAVRLIEQMRQGAPFSALARQFSQAGAAAGGDLGWISEGMLDDEVMKELASMEKGSVTQPMRTIDGYHIILLRDKRIIGEGPTGEPTYELLSIEIPVRPSASPIEREEQLKRLQGGLAGGKSCEEYEKLIKQIPTAGYRRTSKLMASELPREVASMITTLQPGSLSEPAGSPESWRIFAVCGRTEPTGGLPSRDDVRRRLENAQLEIMANRYLRDLRRSAFIEIRV